MEIKCYVQLKRKVMNKGEYLCFAKNSKISFVSKAKKVHVTMLIDWMPLADLFGWKANHSW